jgi:mannose-1-phosphate guanylyltransferase/mannose-6-phosphate isomerase
MHLFPVIMCGGSGTRLWPSSTKSRPKQFLSLVGARSIFQDTAQRVATLPGVAEVVIIAGAAHAEPIERQLAEIGIEAVVLLEPQPRDSAPAIAAAAAWIAGRDPDGVAVIVASDHHLPDISGFHSAALAGAEAAAEGRIVTFGVAPTSPSTAYGYIQPGARRGPAFDVAAFVEKPGPELAADYVAAGYLWNSGNFIASASTLLDDFNRHAPAVREAALAAVERARRVGRRIHLDEGFAVAQKISFDHAIMEKTSRATVLPVAFEWSDLGAWSAIHAVTPRDDAGNAITGTVLTLDTHSSLVRSDGPAVATIGISNLAVIAENGSVLVCDLAADQSVKAVAQHFTSSGQPEPRSPVSLFEDFDLWLRGSALPVWCTLGADHGGWGFHETLSQHGRAAEVVRRARVQARQAYVYARAGRLGWRGPWRAAVARGLDALEQQFRRADGLYRRLVDENGAALDETALLYEQAFVLLALSEAAKVGTDAPSVIARAERLRDALEAYRWPAGGFRETGGQTFQANCQMHLFEACLSWLTVPGIDPGPWRVIAERIAALFVRHLFSHSQGVVREFFGADWQVLEPPAGGVFEPGHQFEWAWLLDRWRALGGAVEQSVINKLYASGRRGLDPTRRVFVNRMTADFNVVDADARLWPQVEALRAAKMMFDRTGGDEFAEDVRIAAAALWRYLDTPIPGLWHDVEAPDGLFVVEPAPGSSLYHLICLLKAPQDVAG